MTRIFLTGATGFLGRELLLRLVRGPAEVMSLVRPREGEGGADALARIKRLVTELDPAAPIERLSITTGDVSAPELGLSPEGRAFLLEGPGPIHLIHGAAQVRFDLPWEEMEKQNIRGTENVLAWAWRLHEQGRLHRLDYVSTTYVAGDRTDLVLESELDRGQTPRNGYERSKLIAEQLVWSAQKDGLPVTVFRPSIIVGDSRTGRASSFKVLYWPLKVYARGRWRTVFGRPDCPVDVVPVDFVADAMNVLLADPAAVGQCLHLAAGPERQATIGSLAAMAQRFFDGPKVRYVEPDFYMKYIRPFVHPILKALRPDVVNQGVVFLPYLRSNPSFDVKVAEKLLSPHGISPPPVESYFETIMGYARDQAFGRGHEET